MMGERIPLGSRALRAAVVLVINVVTWIVVPWLLSGYAAGSDANLPLFDASFILAFGAAISGLAALGELTDGSALSVPFVSGSCVASAAYIVLAAGGGEMQFSASGLQISVSFQTLLFLLALPWLLASVRAPVEFLLERSEASRPAADVP